VAKRRKIYKRLPGKRRLPFWTNSLWIGPDHLLSVDSRSVSENYKRFYYRDIQAIIIRKIDHWKITNIILGSISGIFFLLMLLLEGGWSIFLGVVWSLSFVVFLYYLIWGANCETHIKTAVQIERLPAFYRLRSLSRAMILLIQRIENAQGRLEREALMENRDESTGEILKTRQNQAFIQAVSSKDEKGGGHTILYILLSLYGILVVADMFYNHITYSIMSTLFSLSIGAFAIIALIKQSKSNLSSQLKKTTWIALAFVIIDFITGLILTFYLTLNSLFEGKQFQNEYEMMKMMSEMSPFENTFFFIIYMFTASGALILGVIGLYLVFKTRGQQKGN
jgi:hypothetical protein